MIILSFGEILWDEYPTEKVIGGAPFNFSAHTVKSGAKAYLISAVGDDSLGKETLEEIEKKGVDASLVTVVKGVETGKCVVTLDEKGVPTFTLKTNVAYDQITFNGKVENTDALAFGTLSLRGDFNKKTLSSLLEKKIAKKVFCDLNLRAPFYDEQTVRFCLENANILKISDSEADYLAEKFGFAFDDYADACKVVKNAFSNLEVVIITCGSKGAYATNGSSVQFCPAIKTEVVSTVGAGDSFGAVFLTEYLKGKSIEESLALATKRSAYVVSKKEAIPD